MLTAGCVHFAMQRLDDVSHTPNTSLGYAGVLQPHLNPLPPSRTHSKSLDPLPLGAVGRRRSGMPAGDGMTSSGPGSWFTTEDAMRKPVHSKVKYKRGSLPPWGLSNGFAVCQAGKIRGAGDNRLLGPGQRQPLVWEARREK